jgi:lysine 2,3-aminomutase
LTLHAEDLVPAGLVKSDRLGEIRRVADEFAVGLTEEMADLIDPADPADPIAAQFVPTIAELSEAPDERADPIGDERWSPVPGIVHRYPDRVLLKPILLCPVYCRFCFRREVVGKKNAVLDRGSLDRAFDYIRERPQIWEVIVTGGDPFLLAPRRLAEIVRVLDQIPHICVIRFHTRVPIVDPRAGMRMAVLRLIRAGIPLLSQTVLLRGVNDDAATLEALFRGLVAMRVKPYYLHHADLARGTSHFRIGIAAGQRLVNSLRGRVSGLCQPTYVLDIPGGFGKVPIAPCAVTSGGSSGWIVEDGAGIRHDYPADPDPPAVAEMPTRGGR